MKKLVGGSRIIKTGVAIFLTAWICDLLGWPPVFAVITAIVTLEPTVSDSIKKGIVRFPASAIGSAYAVIFISLFGNSPITYTLAAVLTITTCFKLNLHAGLLVATLTSVAMVEVIHDNFFLAFLIRLGTTTVGLVVSTVVNMFVLPPDYRENISNNVGKITKHTAEAMEKIYRNIFNEKREDKEAFFTLLAEMKKETTATSTLIRFQKEEAKYHPLVASEAASFQRVEEQVELLRRMHDDLDNILHQPINKLTWDKEEADIIRNAVKDIADSLRFENNFDIEAHRENKQKITKIFWQYERMKKQKEHPTILPVELIVLYELLSFYQLVEDFVERGEESRS